MRNRILLCAILLSATALPADDFDKWWPTFQTAVAKNDVKTVAQSVRYPLQWENGPLRDIKTEAEFVRDFNKYFTAEIKRIVAQRKPERYPNGYIITWKARGNEYSIYFKAGPSGGFVLDGLSEGPP